MCLGIIHGHWVIVEKGTAPLTRPMVTRTGTPGESLVNRADRQASAWSVTNEGCIWEPLPKKGLIKSRTLKSIICFEVFLQWL